MKKGDIIQKQGENSENLFIIVSGKVGIFKLLEYFDENDKL